MTAWHEGSCRKGNRELHLDPYVEWALLTGFRGFQLPQDDHVEVLIEAQAPDVTEFLGEPPAGSKNLRVLSPIEEPELRHTTFLTARLPRQDLLNLCDDPRIVRWELGLAGRPMGGSPHGHWKALEQTRIRQPVIAVIDHACPFLHQQFHEVVEGKPKTRIVRLWDQDKEPGTKPWRKAEMGYGRELHATDINGLLQQRMDAVATQGWCEDETATYRRLDTLCDDSQPDKPPFLRSHGTHVLDMAAGSLRPVDDTTDLAGQAPLLFVHLPFDTAADSSGGSLGVRVLDALHYVLLQTSNRVVVNLSYGTHDGPHDGSALIERAIDQLIEQSGRLTVVVGAGNARRAEARARFEFSRRGGPATATLRIPEEDSNDTFVEFWYGGGDEQGAPEIRVTSPDGHVSGWVGLGACAWLGEDGHQREVRAALFNPGAVPNSNRRQLALLALVREEPRSPRPAAPAGDWTIEVQPASGATLAGVDAWVERDDLPVDRAGHTARWADIDAKRPKVIRDTCTLASLSTGSRTIIAGAHRLSDGERLDYSAIGISEQAPQVTGAAEEDSALRGLRAAAVRSSDTTRMGGTSVAAAVVTREVFNALDRTATPAAVRAPTREGASSPCSRGPSGA